MINGPAKIFPCDCGAEGVVVVANAGEPYGPDVDGGPFIDLALFSMGGYRDGRLRWWGRLRWAWRIIRTGNPYDDMVTLRAGVAKNLAYHILYLIDKNKPQPKNNSASYLVPLPESNVMHTSVGPVPYNLHETGI